ncbi:RNA polymerase sigma factor [compost metagenome]
MNIVSLESYLLRAIKNKCLNLLRVRQLVLTDGIEYQDTLIDRNTPEDILISTESIQRIQRAVECLPPKTKEAFKLVKEEKKTYLETAETMGISKKTVDRHIQIALGKLWACMKEKK